MPFKKGKSGNPKGGRKEGTKVAPEFLRDLRHVYGSNKPAEGAEPEPPGRAMLRDLKEKDPARFLERLQRAEREWAAAKQGFVQESAPGASEAAEDDPGTMAALALVEKVLQGVLDAERVPDLPGSGGVGGLGLLDRQVPAEGVVADGVEGLPPRGN